MNSVEPVIELEQVNVARGDQVVLENINLHVQPGEHLVILGPNGCGKSTLLKTLTCELYPLPRPGTRIVLFGRPRWDITALRRMMGVVSAEPPVEATQRITGLEAILTGFFSSSRLWPNLNVSSVMQQRATQLLELVGATPLANKIVGEMSAGQQRRIMIGRAVAGSGERRMLLLDEPSNALDLAAQEDLRLLLGNLAGAGISILMITHHVSDILREMQRVIFMKNGRIVRDGARSELLTAAALSELYERPVQMVERDGILFAW